MIKIDNWLLIENPLKTYNKIKKYFKPLTMQISFGYTNSLFEIESWDLRWKDKWNSPRHEIDPYICISLFKRCLFIRFYYKHTNGEDLSLLYWETALTWLYYNKSLEEACEINNGWQGWPNPKEFLK